MPALHAEVLPSPQQVALQARLNTRLQYTAELLLHHIINATEIPHFSGDAMQAVALQLMQVRAGAVQRLQACLQACLAMALHGASAKQPSCRCRLIAHHALQAVLPYAGRLLDVVWPNSKRATPLLSAATIGREEVRMLRVALAAACWADACRMHAHDQPHGCTSAQPVSRGQLDGQPAVPACETALWHHRMLLCGWRAQMVQLLVGAGASLDLMYGAGPFGPAVMQAAISGNLPVLQCLIGARLAARACIACNSGAGCCREVCSLTSRRTPVKTRRPHAHASLLGAFCRRWR